MVFFRQLASELARKTIVAFKGCIRSVGANENIHSMEKYVISRIARAQRYAKIRKHRTGRTLPLFRACTNCSTFTI